MDLSILIPARNEIFLGKTVEDILKNIRAETEVIVALDGQWPHEPLPQHERLVVLYLPESVGQRAATNFACKLSTAKYVMKVDAHCSFDEGFDVKLMEKMQDDWTMVPLMRNLHAFDWVCPDGHRRYQGPSGPCKDCGKDTDRGIVWHAKESPRSTAYRFDRTLHFQYWNDFKRRPEGKGDITETMSLQGSCWMLTREKYWELDICDEGFGSWGQQGVEVACKTWLSGGRVVVNHSTWYAHMFRTQGGDFGFPFPLSHGEVEHARRYSRELFLENRWPGAKRPFSWILEHFAPVPDWEENKGIIYYTDNKAPLKVSRSAQHQLRQMGLPIVSCSMKPMPHFGTNIHLPGERGALQMFKQILAALEKSTAEYVFFCEADVLYHSSHFAFTPPKKDRWYYNTNVWKWDLASGKKWRVDDCRQVSGICVYRELALEHYRKRVAMVEADGFSMKTGYEPGTHGRPERVDDATSEAWESQWPNVDIRHGGNLSPTRTEPEQFRNERYTRGWREAQEIPGWGAIHAIIGA